MYWRRKRMKNKSLPTRGETIVIVGIIVVVIACVIIGRIYG